LQSKVLMVKLYWRLFLLCVIVLLYNSENLFGSKKISNLFDRGA
jgi:hypothetical protein